MNAGMRCIDVCERLLLGGGIITITILQVANVFTRTLTGRSLAFLEEVCRFAIVWVTFAGLSYAAGQGRHIRMTALVDQLSDAYRRHLLIFAHSLTALLMFLLAGYAVAYLFTLHHLGTVSPVLKVPVWVVYLAAPVGLILAGLQYVFAAIRNVLSDEPYLSWNKKDEFESIPDVEHELHPVGAGSN